MSNIEEVYNKLGKYFQKFYEYLKKIFVCVLVFLLNFFVIDMEIVFESRVEVQRVKIKMIKDLFFQIIEDGKYSLYFLV